MKTVPRVGTFLGRPSSICSGVPIEPRIPVSLQHRSDILIEKQKENLQRTQCELERSLIERKHSKSNDTDAELLRKKVAHLRRSCGQMKIILQLVLKLNAELSYARVDLVKAFEDHMNVNSARKRVVWLEDRIKKILESHWESEGTSLVDYASIESCVSVKVQKSCRYPSSGSRSLHDTWKLDGSASDGKCTPGSRRSSQGLSEKMRSSVDHHHSLTDIASIKDGAALPSSLTSEDKTNENDDSVIQPSLKSDGKQLEEEDGLLVQTQPEKPTEVTSETSNTFITEAASSDRQRRQISRNQSIPLRGDQCEKSDLSEPNESTDYWKSEHHRFEPSILEDVDATSYHQIALAVQGTFATDVHTSPGLPWRQERRASIGNTSEVQMIELNALSKTVSDMFSSVKRGALVSVNSGKDINSGTKSTNLQDGNKRINSCSTFARMPSSVYSDWLPESSSAFPPISERSRTIKWSIGKSLPITRVNRSEQFPRSSDRFSRSVPGVDPPAMRIVDQRNLLEETKFSSTLFQSKRGRRIRPVSVEGRFKQLIAEDSNSKSSVLRNSSCYASRGLSKDVQMTKQQCADLRAAQMTRIEEIISVNLKSSVDNERADAARSLGLLSRSESRAIEALHETLRTDSVERVIYEATRSLALLGSWDQDVQEQLAIYLCIGNEEIKADLLQSMIAGSRQNSSAHKAQAIFSELREILCELCRNDDPSDLVSFRAAVCLAYLDIIKEDAAKKLRSVVNDLSSDPHTKAQALSALIILGKELNEEIVDLTIHQLNHSSVWKYRKTAARYLTDIGLRYKLSSGINDKIYTCLKTALWNDVNSMVRTEAGKALTACGLIQKTCEEVRQHLEDLSDAVRTQAVIAVGTLGMKSERLLKILLNLVQLDPSHKVQQMVIRTFVVLQYRDERVLTILKHKATMDGLVAREAQKALDMLSNHT